MPTVVIDSCELHYERSGSGQPLLLIHGLGSSTRDWEFQLPALEPHCEVIRVDLRGHGRSAKPRRPYSMPRFAADIAGLLRELKVGPAHVIGLSLGGMVAFELAVHQPQLLRSLVVINSWPGSPARTLPARLELIGVYLQRLAIVRLFGMRRMGEVLAARLLPEPEQAALRETFIERWAENDRRAYLASLRAIGGWSVEARLAELRCPTLVVAAEDDYTPLSFKQEYTTRISGAGMAVIPGSRHLSPLDQPAAVNAALLRFLQLHR